MPPVVSPEPVAKQPPRQPLSDDDQDRERLDLRLEPAMRRRIREQAKRFGQKMTPYVKQAIIERLERDEASDPSTD